jgi:hypothetical protein
MMAIIAGCARPGSSCEQRRLDAQATVLLAIEAVRIDTTKALRTATDAQSTLDHLHQRAGEISDELARMVAAGCDHAPLCCATLVTSHAALPFAMEDHVRVASMQAWNAAYTTFAHLYVRRDAARDELAKACADANAAFSALVAATPATDARDTALAKAELDAANQAVNASTQLEALLASWSAGLDNSAAVEPQPVGSSAGEHAHVGEAELAVQAYAQVCGR